MLRSQGRRSTGKHMPEFKSHAGPGPLFSLARRVARMPKLSALRCHQTWPTHTKNMNKTSKREFKYEGFAPPVRIELTTSRYLCHGGVTVERANQLRQGLEMLAVILLIWCGVGSYRIELICGRTFWYDNIYYYQTAVPGGPPLQPI